MLDNKSVLYEKERNHWLRSFFINTLIKVFRFIIYKFEGEIE